MNILDKVQSKFGGVRYSRYLMILCPYHNDHNPSMQVYDDFAYCKSCHKKVPTTQLLQPDIHKRVVTSNGNFRNPFTKWLKKETLAEALETAWKLNLQRPSHYLQGRGIGADMQKKYGLGTRDLWHTFPICDATGGIIGATARAGETNNSPAKYMNPPNQSPNMLYIPNWEICNAPILYLVFGIVDVLSLAILGKFSASTTTGKQLDPRALDWHYGKIVIIGDLGEESAAYTLKNSLGLRASVIIPTYPIGTKDVNDLFVKQPEYLKSLLS